MQSRLGAQVATPTQELKWRRHILKLAILTLGSLLIATVVAITTRGKSGNVETTSAENLEVWADEHTGRYFCPDSVWYGKTHEGTYLTQKEARFAGFRPFDGKSCFVPRER